MKILVVDDHPLIREALRTVLGTLGDGVDVLAADDCAAGFALAEAHPDLDLVLLDLQLPGLAGIAAVREWRRQQPTLALVVLSAASDRATVLDALRAGAAGFIPKSSTNEIMLTAIRLVLAGGKYLPPETLATGLEDPSPRPRTKFVPALSGRQMEVLRLIAQGQSNKEICRVLGLAERTVKAHVTAVLRALDVDSRTQAAVAAARLGIGEAPPRR